MVDFDLQKELEEKGLSFKSIFRSIFIYSMSLFIGFYWKDLFTQAIDLYFPVGQNLREKFLIGVALTVILVCFAWLMLRTRKRTLKPTETK